MQDAMSQLDKLVSVFFNRFANSFLDPQKIVHLPPSFSSCSFVSAFLHPDSFLAGIKRLIPRRDLPRTPARAAVCDDVGRNIARNGAVRADPAVSADMNRLAKNIPPPPAAPGINRMPCRCKRDVRPKKRAVSDINRCVVHKRKIEVCTYVLSEMNEHSAKIRRKRGSI